MNRIDNDFPNITISQARYLDAIFSISKEKECRAKDLVSCLSVSKPAVSNELQRLKNNNVITISEEKVIRITSYGHEIINYYRNRFKIIFDLLVKLGVAEEIAENDANQIKYRISDESILILGKALLHLE